MEQLPVVCRVPVKCNAAGKNPVKEKNSAGKKVVFPVELCEEVI